MNFRGKKVLIAGGSSGMGLAVASAVIKEGGIVHLVASNIKKLDQAVNSLGSNNVVIHALNIGDEKQVQALANEVDNLDHLVTTAARLTFKPLIELTRKEIDEMLSSKFYGPVFLTQKLAPKINPGGSIVYFSGVAADKGGSGASIVGAVNGALHGLAKNLAYELSPIRVNVVSPGVVASPTWDFMKENERKDFYQKVADSLPAKIVGTPDDLAKAAIFLMENPYVNGTIVTVDGGSNA